MRKSLATMLAVALVAGAFLAAPAEAKKKKKKKKDKPVACAPYTPGEQGAEAETVVVTDAATAEAPATHAFSLDVEVSEGILGELDIRETPSHFVNVQVDSAAAEAGLYATFEFPTRRDYDMYAYWPTGEEAASSHGFNPLIDTKGTPVDESNTKNNHAGDTQAGSENIVGVVTPDCGGYTFGLYNYLGEGGDFELKLWLGEGKEAPKPPGEGG